MDKKILFRVSLITAAVLFSGIILSSSAFALMPRYSGSPFPTPKETAIPRPTRTSTPRSTNDHDRVSTCKSRQMVIDNAFKNLYKTAIAIKSKFDSISSRVQTYYTSKIVPSGKAVANYESIVAGIESKKAAAEEALATTQADINAFNCDNNDLNSDVAKIRADLKNLKNTLKEYKKSIKELIMAIRSVTGAGGNREITGSSSASPRNGLFNLGNKFFNRGQDRREDTSSNE